MRFMHFPIKASFTVDTKGWYCVGKRQHFFSFLTRFCFRSADFGFCEFAICLSICVGSLCSSSTIKRSFEFETLSSNFFDKSVGGDKPQNVCWKVSVVFTTRIIFRLISCLCKQLCLKTLSQWVSVVNLIVGSCKFASSKKGTMCCLKTV